VLTLGVLAGGDEKLVELGEENGLDVEGATCCAAGMLVEGELEPQGSKEVCALCWPPTLELLSRPNRSPAPDEEFCKEEQRKISQQPFLHR